MLSDIIFSLPDGRDAVVRLDTTLDKNEIRVGSLGALDQFMTDASKVKDSHGRAPIRHRKVVRLSITQIVGARAWLKDNYKSLNPEQKAVMDYFFPQGKDGMQPSKALENRTTRGLDMPPERARTIRNNLLRKAGILS